MSGILLFVLGIFPYQGIVVGGGQWTQSSPFKYQSLAPEFSIFVGGWPVVGENVKKDFLLLFEGGYNFGKKTKVPSMIPEISLSISYQDLFLGSNVLQEFRLRPTLKILYGVGISWHTLSLYKWGYSYYMQSKDTEGRLGFSVNFGVAKYIIQKVGIVGWLRFTKVFLWDKFDPSRVQFYIGIFQDLRGILTSTEPR